MKRITSSLLALLLALSMLIGMVPAAFAVDAADTPETRVPDAIEVQSTEEVEPLSEGSAIVARIGTSEYTDLVTAMNALTAENHTLELVDQTAWPENNPVYWAAGEKSGYVATLTDALTAAYKENAGDIKIVCRPGADVGTMTHGHVADNITIYGNNAYISGGECDLEVDTFMFSRSTGAQDTTNGVYLDKDIVINAYELDNLGVWGERHTGYTVSVNLTDCDGKALEKNVQRVYISGTTGKNEITLKNCDFITAATAVYSNADGQISIDTCSFTGSKVPVNFNHKANGEQRLTVSNSTFKNCGDNGEWNQFAAPVRFVNSGSGTQSATVDTCTFAGTVGSNGDILIGDGRTGQASNNVSLTVTNTKATVQAQKPGYYNGAATDKNNGAEMKVESGETLNTSVEKMLPTALTAYVTVNGGTEQYATLDEAIAAAGPENGVITYTVTGKVNANGESWIQVAKAGLTGLTEVKFVGADANAEICITNSTAVLADQSYDIDVSFKDLTLSHPNGAWVGDLGHATNYFTTVLRNTDAANNTVSYTNCTFPNGACNNQYGKTVYANCKFTNATSGKYNLWNYGGNTEIKNSTFTGTRGIKTYNEGTLAVAPTVKIENTTFDSLTEKAAVVASKATDITFDNVTTKDCAKGTFQKDIENSGEETTIKANGSGISGSFNITAGKGEEAAKKEFNISAGTFNSEVSRDYCADGFEVKDNGNGTYGVVESAETKPDGYQEDANGNVTISDEDGLFWFAKQVNENGNTFAGKTVVLAADIDLKNAAWTPIGTSTNQFKGTFDGQNKTISNISANCPSMENVGLFGFATNCTLKNVTLENVDIKGKKNVGGLAGTVYAGSTVENVTVKGNIKISASVQYVGGIAGGYSYAKYVNCKVIGDGADSSYIQDTLVGDYTNYAGGIVGLYGEGAAGITGCEVSDITIRTVGYGAGGITGVLQYNNRVSDCKVKNVVIDSQPADSNGWAGTLAGKDYTKNGSNTSWLINNTIENTVIKVGGVEIANQYMGDDHTGTYPPHEEYEANAIIGTDVEYDESGKITAGTFITVGAKARETLESSISDSKSLSKGSDDTYNVTEKKAYVAEINGTGYETLDAAIAAAKDGETITVNAGEYKLNGSLTYTGKAFTIKAADGAKVSFDMSAAVALHGAKITFENVTFDYKTNGNYIGMQHTDTLVYNSCTINGQAFLYATNETFNKCTFNQSSKDAYNVWTYGAKNVAFNSCTFNCAGKSVLVYNEGSNEQTDLTVTNTQFNASETVNGKAAIEIDTSLMNGGATVIVDDKSTATGFSNETTDKAGLWNVKKKSLEKNKVLDVTVAGEKVYSLPVAVIGTAEYPTITAAITAAADGDTVKLLADTTEDVVINKNITLDLGGKTLTNTNAGKATISVTGGTVTVKNGNVIGGTDYYNIEVTKGSNANLTLEGVTATAGNTDSSMIDNYGTLTITSGEYSGGLNVVKSEEGSTLTINGGTFELNHAVGWSYNGVILSAGMTKISGGNFIQNAKTPARSYPSVIMAMLVEGYTSKIEITGGSFTNNKSDGKIFYGYGKATSDNFEVSGGTFNKSIPAGYCADGFIPTKNADGTYGVKEGKYVAQIGSKYYETLADAIRLAAKGKTITLLANVKESVEISKNLTLDLNGFTLTNEGAKHTITVNEGVSLTIKDSVGTGTVDNVTHGHGALVNNGTVILSGGTFERSAEKGTLEPYGNGGNSWYTIANYGTMTIDNGTTVKNAGGYSSNIRNGGQDSTAKLTINGGTFDGGVNTVKNDANGVLEIKGGELKNTAQYVIMNWNQATISGGTFETAETAGAVLFSSAYGNDGTACGELTITGGTFKAAGSKLIDDAYDANNHGTVKISGGSFNRAVDPKHCDTGFIPTQNEDGTYGVKEGTYVAETGGVYYESLQAAIDAAPRKGTVKLLADTRENVTINTPYLTLDLNGHTLNGGTEKGKPALTVTARVTVKDGSEAQTGTIMREDTAENSGVSSHYVIDIQGSGWLTFESGKVTNGSGNDKGKGASLVRVGDDSVAKYPGLNIKGGTFTQDNFIVIKVDRGDLFLNGGTLNSANSYAIEDWHRATIKGGTVNGAVAAWTYSGGLNSDLTISGGTINGDVTSVNYGNAEGKTAKVSITGGTINGKLDTRSYDPATNELTSIDDAAKATIEVTGGTFNNDPTKYVVENSKVTNNADGTFGVEKAYLAKVGETSYYTMEEAFKAQTASGKPIVLLRDYTTGSPFNSGTINRTVDLNGHTWTCTGTDANSAAFEINNPNVTLTVKNGKIVSSQLVGLIPSAMGGTIKYDNSGLVFEGVEMSTTATSGIETNGNNTNDSVTLKNSTLNVPNGFGIYFPSSGTLTIENSKINAKTMGVQVCAGSLSINEGSAITVSDGPVDKTENDGAIQDGAAISIVNRTGYKGLGTITVTGGTFTAKSGNAAIKAYNYADKTESSFTESDKVEVSGGTFSAEVPADLCAVGYEPTEKDPSTGMYTVQKVSGNAYYVDDSGKPVYGDFAALVASTNTATKGKTITLLKDVKIEDNLVLFGNRTVDLNGNVLEITEIFIGLYGKVIDSSDGNGLLKIAADNVTLQSDNGLLPIYDSAKGGYRLFNVQMKGMTEGKGNGVVVKLMPSFTNKDAYKLMKVGSTNNITFAVTISWMSENGPASQEFTFDQSLVNRVAESWMNGKYGYFIITLTGLDSDVVGSIKDIKAQGSIKSGTGARIDSIYYDIPQN